MHRGKWMSPADSEIRVSCMFFRKSTIIKTFRGHSREMKLKTGYVFAFYDRNNIDSFPDPLSSKGWIDPIQKPSIVFVAQLSYRYLRSTSPFCPGQYGIVGFSSGADGVDLSNAESIRLTARGKESNYRLSARVRFASHLESSRARKNDPSLSIR